jgi:hypothetical protein
MLNESLSWITDWALETGFKSAAVEMSPTAGEHDGKVVRITVSVLCSCDECCLRRAMHDGMMERNMHNDDHEEDDEEETPGEDWKNN